MVPEIRFYVGEYSSLGPFQLDRSIVLGRGADCDLALPDDALSRKHCRVDPDTTGVTVVDVGSTNGIFFEGQVVRQCRVGFGSEFWIGRTRCMIAVAGVAAEPLPGAGHAPMPYGGPTPPPRPAYGSASPAEGETTAAMMLSGSPPAAIQSALDKTAPPFTAAAGPGPSASASYGSSPSGRVERTQPPFQAAAPGGGGPGDVVRTQAPFPAPFVPSGAPVGAGAAPLGLPEVRVYVSGQPRRVSSLDFHFAAGQDGTPYLRVVVGYDDPAGTQTGSIWLPGA